MGRCAEGTGEPASAEQRELERLLGVALGILAALLVFVFAQRVAGRLAEGTSDLRLYLAAAQILAGPNPELLYDWSEQQRQQAAWAGGSSPFINPPFVALLFLPLLGLPHAAAQVITAVISAALLAAAMLCAARIAGGPAGLRAWPVLALAVLAQPLALGICLDVQPAPVAALAWAGFSLAWLRGRPAAAAAWLLPGLAVKPHLVLPLCFFVLCSGRWRATGVLVGGAALLGLAAWALIGTEGLARYPAILEMVGASRHWAVNATAMPNLRGVLAILFGEGAMSRAAAAAASAAVLAAMAWLAWGSSTAERARGEQRTPARAGAGPARALVVLVALAGTMLASYHMHVQELTGLYILLALGAAAGWLTRRQFVAGVGGLTAALWTLSLLGSVWRAAWLLVPLLLLAVFVRGVIEYARGCGEGASLRGTPGVRQVSG